MLALLPSNLDRKIKAIAAPLRGPLHGLTLTFYDTKVKQSLPWLLRELATRHPRLQRLCDQARTVLVDPILEGRPLPITYSLRLYLYGDLKTLPLMPLEVKLSLASAPIVDTKDN